MEDDELGRSEPIHGISVVIPTLNEESTIFQVAKSFLETQKTVPFDIFVIDGHSEDRTVEMAKRAGAKVAMQNSRGKGMAMIEAAGKNCTR
jgi:glycosyltransferase involved in cell wall biosynthesis